MRTRGASVTNLFIWIFLAAALWVGSQFFIAYFADTKIEQHLTEIILKNRQETNDGVLAETVAKVISEQDEISVDPKLVRIFRSSDGQSIRIEVPYKKNINIPGIKSDLGFTFTAVCDEKLNARH